jgi:ubiquinone biosynthesis O-methyltransferase
MPKANLQKFYDSYHQKNKRYDKVIGDNNFTYFYIQKLVKKNAPVPLIGVITRHNCNNRCLLDLKILDTGCAVGSMAFWLASKGAQVTGVDISKRAINIAKQAQKSLIKQYKWAKNVNFECRQLTNNTAKRDQDKYDLITATEIIEHIENDDNFLKKIHSHLKKNGRLILTTPSPDNWWYKLGLLDKFDQQVGHLRRYDKKILKTLLKKNDFKIISFEQKEGPLRSLLFTTRLGFLIKFIRGPFIPIFHLVDDWLALITGGTDWQVVLKKF